MTSQETPLSLGELSSAGATLANAISAVSAQKSRRAAMEAAFDRFYPGASFPQSVEALYREQIIPTCLKGADPSVSTDELLTFTVGVKALLPDYVFPVEVQKAFSSETLARRSGYLVEMRDGAFHYFQAPVEERTHWFEFVNPVPRLRGALFLWDKQIYFVTADDLARGRVRKQRLLPLKRGTLYYADLLTPNIFPYGRDPDPSYSSPSNVDTSSPPPASLRPRSGSANETSEDEDLLAAEMAFQDQICAVLGVSSPEEIVWEKENNPQPINPVAVGPTTDPATT